MVHDLERSSNAADRLLRESRLDWIAEGKSRLWKNSLRLSQLANGLILAVAILFLIWRGWALWAAFVAAAFTVVAMWIFARWMGRREQQLCRHIAYLAKHRRTCANCDYALYDLISHRCPECGTPFDPDDTRHILRSETVRLYSSRARATSGITIVFVLVWVSAMVQREAWWVHLLLFLGLLGAFHGLYFLWHYGNRAPSNPRCTKCDTVLCECRGTLPASCPECDRALTYGTVFIRPDVRFLSDRRIASVQYRSLMMRWVFLLAVCGGLTVLTNIDLIRFSRRIFGGGQAMGMLSIVLPVLVWVMVSTAVFRNRAKSLQRQLKQLVSRIAPACGHCDGDLSEVPVGQACPGCRRPVQDRWIVG
ncbi:MAG: hypothetical protein ACE5EQ_00610 [Phycisphaerae bacterium]